MKQLPKISLLSLPTPLTRLDRLSALTGCNLYLKHDDLTDFGMGGNKLRKLEYLIADAKQQGATLLMTYGGAQTNHGRLTAAAAARCGLKCAILCLDQIPEQLDGNLLLDRLLGADVYVRPSDGSDEALQNEQFGREIRALYEARGETVFEIPVGGSNVVGLAGYMDCARELKEQCDQLSLKPDLTVCAAGSLGTWLGLWLGAQDVGLDTDVCGIAISPFQAEKEQRLMQYLQEACDFYEIENRWTREDFHVETDYVGEGYNSLDFRARQAIYTMARNEGILLDPCYTGKAFAGLLDMIKIGKIKPGSTVIFVHTGGSPALYAGKHTQALLEEIGQDGYFPG